MSQFSPPEDPNIAKRTLLAFALTLALIAGAQYFLSRNAPPKPQPQAQQAQPSAPAQPPASQPAAPAATPAAPAPQPAAAAAKAPAQAPAAPARAAVNETTTVIESDLYKVTFTNKGGQATSWVLKQYKDDKGKPLELVNTAAAQKFGYPLSLWTYDDGLRSRLNSALYQVSTGDRTANNQPQRTIAFDYAEGGLAVHKAFTFDLEPGGPKGKGALGYVVRVEISVTQNGAPVEALAAWPAGFGDQTVQASYAAGQELWATGERNWRGAVAVNRTNASSVSGGKTISDTLLFGGAGDQYFAAVFIPDQPQEAAMVMLRSQITIPKNLDKPDPTQSVSVDVIGAAIGNRTGATGGRFFVGPKALEVLDQVRTAPFSGEPQGTDIEGLLDYGKYFGWLAKPLFIATEWIHDHAVPNWGWAIVVMTILINAIMLPLRYSGMKSMMRMQKIKPQMDAIQAKYKKLKPTDPKRSEMQKELGELYKREGVNPVGGCLPMGLQMPVWIAFYSVLGVAIELRHAPWLWVKDLSQADLSLAVLTVVSMFVLQLISPQPGGDPMQQKLMLVMMPLMFGWFSYRVASGLALYWVWGSVVGILFQIWLNNSAFGKEMRATIAKREAKKRS